MVATAVGSIAEGSVARVVAKVTMSSVGVGLVAQIVVEGTDVMIVDHVGSCRPCVYFVYVSVSSVAIRKT